MEFIIVLLVIVIIANVIQGQTWDYQHQAKWYDDFNECSLKRQSPIEINSKEAIVSYFMPPIKFHNFNMTCSDPAIITNNGHSASISLSQKCNKPQITGGPLPYDAIFEAMSFHFHWGSKDAHGSEHIINSERYSIEAHIVHKNTKYSSMDVAGKHRDGLAVQAIFYKVNATKKTSFVGLDNIAIALKDIRNFNSTSALKNTHLSALFGNIDTNHFYTYEGSLTTPPCSQAVTWILFPHVIDINSDQAHQFRLLTDVKGGQLVNNYRFIQPKDERSVYYRSEMTDVTIVNLQGHLPLALYQRTIMNM